MLGGILALVAPVVLGSWLVRRLLGSGGHQPGFGLTVSMGAITGLGLASVALWWSYLAGVPLRVWWWVELAMVVASVVLLARWCRRRRGVRAHEHEHEREDVDDQVYVSARLHRLISVAALLCLGAAVAAVVIKMVFCPHGEWDAWAIWNLHARFIFRDTAQSLGYLDAVMDWTHPDYPLLVPLTVVRGWTLNRGESVVGPALLGPVYMLASVGLVYFGLARQQGKTTARLALITLLAAPVVSQNAAAQLADTPLAGNTLLCVVCCFLGVYTAQPRYLLLGGIAAGLAAWTKNEGLFVVLALAGLLLPALRQRSRGQSLRQLAWLAAGLLPGLVTLALFWQRVGGYGGGTLATLSTGQAMTQLTTTGRLWPVAVRYLQEPLNLRVWGAAPFMLALCPLVLGLAPDQGIRRSALAAGLVVALLHAAQFVMFVIIPGDQAWLMDSALHRLLLHGFPSALLVVWTLVRPVGVVRDSGPGGSPPQ